jgi:hypothetical protein
MSTKEYFKKRYLIKREEILFKQKEKYKKLKKLGLLKKYDSEYYKKNKEKALENQRRYRATKKGKIKDMKYRKKKGSKISAKFFQKNKKRILEKKYLRLKTDPNFKMKHVLGVRIRKVLKGIIKKSKSTQILVGCTIEELWIHLEKSFKPGMTRENHGLWHVDHIRPCSSFDLSKPEEQIKCFHYTNLQALWAHENLSKNNRIL